MLVPRETTTRERKSLDGLWRFSLDTDGVGRAERWWEHPLTGAREVPLPSSYNDVFPEAEVRNHMFRPRTTSSQPCTSQVSPEQPVPQAPTSTSWSMVMPTVAVDDRLHARPPLSGGRGRRRFTATACRPTTRRIQHLKAVRSARWDMRW